jgi:hypothetical protein
LWESTFARRDELPDSIDLLIVSTGLTESLALLCQTLPGNEAQKYQELSNGG